MLLHINITEVSFYQILKHRSNNYIRNGSKYYVSFDNRAESGL